MLNLILKRKKKKNRKSCCEKIPHFSIVLASYENKVRKSLTPIGESILTAKMRYSAGPI